MDNQIKQRIEQILRGEVPEGYKKSKVGVVPCSWATSLLGDIYTERKESGIPSLPILTVSIHSGVSDGALDEDELGKKVKRIEDKTQYRTARAGDVVFNMMRAWQGAIGIVRQDGLVSPAYIVATPNEAVDPPFMDYCLKTPRMINRLHRKSYGVTDFRLRLYWDSFAKVDCVLPPLPEQEKIAEILSVQDKLLALKEKRIEEKKRQKKALMQQLLTGKKRLPGFKGKWRDEKLGNLATMNSGGTPDSSLGKNYGRDFIWISISDMSASRKYVYSSEKGLSKCGYENSSAKLYPAGTVLFAMYASVGECSIAANECCSSQAILGIETGKELNNEYLYYFLLEGRERFKKLSQASSQPNLNKKIVQNITIDLPDLAEQEAITVVLSTIDKEIDYLYNDLDQEKQKKKALMQLLLTGIVRV